MLSSPLSRRPPRGFSLYAFASQNSFLHPLICVPIWFMERDHTPPNEPSTSKSGRGTEGAGEPANPTVGDYAPFTSVPLCFRPSHARTRKVSAFAAFRGET